MLFNSYEFIFYFLPAVLIGYFLLNYAKQDTAAKIWLVAASLYFYSFWNFNYLYLILASILVNYAIGTYLSNASNLRVKKPVLTVGIVLNVLLLGYYKYTDFFLETINGFVENDYSLLGLMLPLAISFFTFQQIAYLVDSYRMETKGYKIHDYMLFVIFFPQLIAGPIVHHREVMSQFQDSDNRRISMKHISLGLFIFGVGLFKKVMIADTFAVWANDGYARAADLYFVESWIASLSYTFQLYFDFSGYCDMAMGAALLFNIRLPLNFNSPYKALNIQDFWRRWHITLSRFLTEYIYKPLGGNRISPSRTYINIFIIFMISGFWHGAGWTFIIWGALHGVASVIYRWWSRRGYSMPKILGWFITFQFVNMAWVFFRAESVGQALTMLKIMFGFENFILPARVAAVVEQFSGVLLFPERASFYTSMSVGLIVIALAAVIWRPNSFQMMERFKPDGFRLMFILVLFFVSVLQLGKVTEFLYFNF
ncbi:MBOAT family O-acyltransferase [Fictibacillus aquaticus]|uniref:Membrane-bound O-acyltransferase family protein n=1 Tax=Fictibacillus aquaticus TaxID=2021314 RepID=A0A235F917_9BACL|nr:MBOAT family protein [Fictibacillus aquaticus]OYD57752.1 membrane-bound O-acyltransferase family protein [Fictibacillus aquaticus]